MSAEEKKEQFLNFIGYDKQVLIDWYNRNKSSYPDLLKSGSDFTREINRNGLIATTFTQSKNHLRNLMHHMSKEKSVSEPLFYFDNMLFKILIFEQQYISIKVVAGKSGVYLYSNGLNIDIVNWSMVPQKILRNPGILLKDSGQDRDELIAGAVFGGAQKIVDCVMSFRDFLIDEIKVKRELVLEEGRKNLEKKATENLNFLAKIKEEYDKDGNGVIDISESHNQLELLLKENKDTIQLKYPEHIKNFIKIIAYLKKSQGNLQFLYSELTSDENLFKTSNNFEHLETAIESHQLVSFNSMYLLNSLLDDDLFTFHEISEKFDALGVFNSTYQNDVSQQLRQVNNQLSTIASQLEILNTNCLEIVDGLNDLNWATKDMQESLESKLVAIDQGIAFSNLNAIYQSNKLRQINKKLS